MPEPLTAAVIVSLFFSEAIKESGKSLVTGVTTVFSQLVHTIREKFKAENIEGVLTLAENNPTEVNKTMFQTLLQAQMDKDAAFTNAINHLVEQLRSQDEGINQVVLSGIELSGDLKAKDIRQKASGDGNVNQKMLTDIKAVNIDVGNLSQEA